MASKDLQNELNKALADIEILGKENERLKSLIKSFQHKGNGEPFDKVNEVVPEDETATSEEKIKIFRSYFKGREDVHAVRWTNRSGSSGYSPACYYEWNPTICNKPNSKCENCKYIPVDDEIIRKHLSGKQIIGVYPLLKNETCWFLAVDFDRSNWIKDAEAFISTCREFDLPYALERSRSGNGCHVWFFFSKPIPASTARKLGTGILTVSMEKRRQIGFDSYDRLFPNQDTLPKGGFGNLIALPLQGKTRKKGNTVFLDDIFEPHADQWTFLSGVKKLSLVEIDNTLRSLKKNRFSTIDIPIANSHEPWTLPPSGERLEKMDGVVLPKKVKIVKGNLVYVEKKELPPALINRIIRLAAFQNPEFFKAQAMRLSTYGKPRIISCSEEFEHHIGLPRGILDSLLTLFSEHGINCEITDERNSGISIELNFQGELRPEQLEAGKKILKHDIGVLSLPTAFGKTVIAAWLLSKRKSNTLILVHRRQLLEQWLAQLSIFLNLPSKNIGQIGAGKNKPTKIVDIGIIQSLNRKGEINDIIAEYGHVIIDECHHVPAFSFESLLKQVKAKYVLGLTATPIRKDGHHPIIIMQCGPIRHHIKNLSPSLNQFGRKVILRKTSFKFNETNDHTPIQNIYAALIKDEQRNDLIFNDILLSLENKRSPLLLTERTSHLEYFANRLKGFAKNIIVLKGGLTSKKLKNLMDQIASIPDDEERIILATGRYIGEGFDDRRLDTLFLVMPISWKGTLQQYVGRLHRRHRNKSLVQVFDYVDVNVPMLSRMFQKRLRGYQSLGYKVEDVNPHQYGIFDSCNMHA